MKLKKHKHYPITKANEDYENNSKKRIYKVTTINWTYATEKGKKNYNKVHKNVYLTTLNDLIEWVRKTEEVAEDIIKIEQIGDE